jgi:hypothetical protein
MAASSDWESIDDLLGLGFEGLQGTLEQRVQELADREEIRELVARYAQRVSRRQSPADMFTGDGTFIVHMAGHPTQTARGPAELAKVFAAAVDRPSVSMPAIHNHVIWVRGDEAVGTSWIELHVTDETAPDGRVFAGSGYYTDRMRRENGRWKFVTREADVRIVGAVQRPKPAAAK